MFSKTRTCKSTGPFSARLSELNAALAAADAVVVGAGAGLSAALIPRCPHCGAPAAMNLQNPGAVYACINRGEAFVPPQLAGQAIAIDVGIAQVIRQLSV